MRMAGTWGSAFAVALAVHLSVFALVGQGLLAETALEPQFEYMEVELAPLPPAAKPVQAKDVPAASNHSPDLSSNKQVYPAARPAASRLAPVREQTEAWPQVAAVAVAGLSPGVSSSDFSGEAGAGAAAGGGTGNSVSAGGTGPAAEPVDRRPSLAYAPLPEYPVEARRNHWQGKVFVSVLVTAAGRAAEAKVAESSGYDVLDQAAVNVVLYKWRFNPAERGGQAVPGRVRVPVTFSLDR